MFGAVTLLPTYIFASADNFMRNVAINLAGKAKKKLSSFASRHEGASLAWKGAYRISPAWAAKEMPQASPLTTSLLALMSVPSGMALSPCKTHLAAAIALAVQLPTGAKKLF